MREALVVIIVTTPEKQKKAEASLKIKFLRGRVEGSDSSSLGRKSCRKHNHHFDALGARGRFGPFLMLSQTSGTRDDHFPCYIWPDRFFNSRASRHQVIHTITASPSKGFRIHFGHTPVLLRFEVFLNPSISRQLNNQLFNYLTVSSYKPKQPRY
jgi:hypothetical protein